MFWVTDSLLIMKGSCIFWMEYWQLFWQSWSSVFIVISPEKGKKVWNATLGWVPTGIITCCLILIPLQHCSLWYSLAVFFKPSFTAAQQKPLSLSEVGVVLCWLTQSLYVIKLIKESWSFKIAQFSSTFLQAGHKWSRANPTLALHVENHRISQVGRDPYGSSYSWCISIDGLSFILRWEEAGVNSSTFIEAIQIFYSVSVIN